MNKRILVVRTSHPMAYDAVVNGLNAEGILAQVDEYPIDHPAFQRLDKAQQKPKRAAKFLADREKSFFKAVRRSKGLP